MPPTKLLAKIKAAKLEFIQLHVIYILSTQKVLIDLTSVSQIQFSLNAKAATTNFFDTSSISAWNSKGMYKLHTNAIFTTN